MKNIKNIWLTTFAFCVALLGVTFFALPASAENQYPSASTEKKPLRPLNNAESRSLQQVFQILQKYYVDEVDPDVLYRGAMEGMINAIGDPYTVYVYRDTMLSSSLKDTTEGSFGGIGVMISKPVVSTATHPAYVQVSAPLEDTPGWKAGIQPGDLIVKIGDTATDTITMEEVLQMLRGKAGTKVTITIKRGSHMEFPVTITRAIIEVPTIKYTSVNGDVGYVRLIEFTRFTALRMTEALQELEEKGCRSFIIDLRGNPGGLISSAVDVSSVFLKSGVVVSTRGRDASIGDELRVKRSSFKLSDDYPVIVLIDRNSASASEIVSGALKDHKRAYLVGERSYGKGSVQNIVDLNQNETIKLTIARYYTPSGANIDKIGIEPDTEVKDAPLTIVEEKALSDLLNTDKLAEFVDSRKTLSKSQTKAFAKKLAKEYPLPLKMLERLIKRQFNRAHVAPVVDLEYDSQLKKAIEIIKTRDVFELLKHTKTVQEQQPEDETKSKK